MKRKLLNLAIIFILTAATTIYSQSESSSKYLEMKNSFILGLGEKGLEIASELLSMPEYSDVREETVFYIAEFFLMSGIGTDEIGYINKAYTYYIVYNNDYPHSIYSEIVNKRINTLESFYGDLIDFRNLNNLMENEAVIVGKKLSFTSELYSFFPPNPYLFFLNNEGEQSSLELLDRYFDEIIVNHPDFEIYGYYWKIISRLSKIEGLDFIRDGILEKDINEIILRKRGKFDDVDESIEKEGHKLRREIEDILKNLSKEYPHHPITLNLHLIMSRIFMYVYDGKIDLRTKGHLEFVVQNELDKTHPRYLLAKEFLLSNKFH